MRMTSSTIIAGGRHFELMELAADRVADAGDAVRWCRCGRTPFKTTPFNLPRTATRFWPAGSRAPVNTASTRTTRWWPAGSHPPTRTKVGASCTYNITTSSRTSKPLLPLVQQNYMDTAKEQAAQIASLELKIMTLTEELAAALAQIQQLHIAMHRPIEDRQNENQVLQKIMADLTMATAVFEEALDPLSSPTPSTRTSYTRTPPTTLRATEALHPFSVTHFDTDIQYSHQDFRVREPTTSKFSPRPREPTSQISSAAVRTSSPPGLSRVPLEIVHLLDEAMAIHVDLISDPDFLHEPALDAMDEIYEETHDHEFWEDDDAFTELDRLLKTRYSQFILK